MKYPIFKVKFLLEKITVERREMAHSIRLEKLYHIIEFKNFQFFFVFDYLKSQKIQGCVIEFAAQELKKKVAFKIPLFYQDDKRTWHLQGSYIRNFLGICAVFPYFSLISV